MIRSLLSVRSLRAEAGTSPIVEHCLKLPPLSVATTFILIVSELKRKEAAFTSPSLRKRHAHTCVVHTLRERPQIHKCLKAFQMLRKRFKRFDTLKKLFEMLIERIETFV